MASRKISVLENQSARKMVTLGKPYTKADLKSSADPLIFVSDITS